MGEDRQKRYVEAMEKKMSDDRGKKEKMKDNQRLEIN